MCGKMEADKIEKEFKYNKEMMGLMKVNGKVNVDEFTNTKTIQEENIKEKLSDGK